MIVLFAFVSPGWIESISLAHDLFSNQTIAQGVSFRHHLWNEDDLIFVGAGAAWGDFDQDGDPDLYVPDQAGPNRLFENLGGGDGFEDRAADFRVDDPQGIGHGALWGDYDNDGDADLFLMNRGDNVMFRNDGTNGAGSWFFTDVTALLGVGGGNRRTTAAAYGDYDNDGWLDLYVVNHYYPVVYPDAPDPDNADQLFHNVEGPDGERVFEDVGPLVFGIDFLQQSVAHSVGFLDFDNDSDLDIFVLNEDWNDVLRTSVLWRNDGPHAALGWSFVDVTSEVGIALDEAPMGLAIGDYNNDGWLDMATSDIGPNHLFRNDGGSFVDVAGQAGVDRPLVPDGTTQYTWGVVFLDYDFDGFEDFFVAAGRLPAQNQPDALFRNQGTPMESVFEDMSDHSGCGDPAAARTVVKADYDGDGDEDFYVVNYDGEAQLYRNEQTGGAYFVLRLIGDVSNRDAIGARVKLSADGMPNQYRMVQSGSTTGGGHDLSLHFGVTGATLISELTIDWPSGLQTVLRDLTVNQTLTVYEIPPPPPEDPNGAPGEEPDVTAPSLTLIAPEHSDTIITAQPTISASGTAADDRGIVSIFWSSSSGGSGPCFGISPWSSGPIPLATGENVITFTALDASQNAGSVSITVLYEVEPSGEPTEPPPGNDNGPPDEPVPPDPGGQPGSEVPGGENPPGHEVPNANSGGEPPDAPPPGDDGDPSRPNGGSRPSAGACGAIGWMLPATLLFGVQGWRRQRGLRIRVSE